MSEQTEPEAPTPAPAPEPAPAEAPNEGDDKPSGGDAGFEGAYLPNRDNVQGESEAEAEDDKPAS